MITIEPLVCQPFFNGALSPVWIDIDVSVKTISSQNSLWSLSNLQSNHLDESIVLEILS